MPVASYLAGAGVGTLYLNDFDTVDLSNLHRQVLYTTDDIGRRKTDVARERLMALNPQVNLTTLSERLNAAGLQEIAERATVVLDCSDNFATRFAVANDATAAARRPLLSGAAILVWKASWLVFRNDLDPGLRADSSALEEGMADRNAVAAASASAGSSRRRSRRTGAVVRRH